LNKTGKNLNQTRIISKKQENEPFCSIFLIIKPGTAVLSLSVRLIIEFSVVISFLSYFLFFV